MKKGWILLVPLLALGTALRGQEPAPGTEWSPPVTVIEVVNDIATYQSQNVSAVGGTSVSDSRSDSVSQSEVNIDMRSDVQTRTPPLTSLPPYLPHWTHAGWGTVKAYFPNAPTINDQIYETTFDPENPEDMRELRSVLRALPHDGVLAAVGSVLNTLAVTLFGAPDRYHHGRGLEIANSVTRDRRPQGKPLLVFIDSNVDMTLLREEGYAYVGKVSIEGDVERNWDHAYKAAVTEALLWDVDILLVSGGMKGVTTGSNVTFPSAAAGYSQVNYSLSLFGARANGITEGKGKAVLSAEAYRFNPRMLERRQIPAALYDRIRFRPMPVMREPVSPPPATDPSSTLMPQDWEPQRTRESWEPLAPRDSWEAQTPMVPAEEAPTPGEPVEAEVPEELVETRMPREFREPAMPKDAWKAHRPGEPLRAPTPAPHVGTRIAPPVHRQRGPGISMSRELYDMAGFRANQQVEGVNLR